jgi:hypothetical protein
MWRPDTAAGYGARVTRTRLGDERSAAAPTFGQAYTLSDLITIR